MRVPEPRPEAPRFAGPGHLDRALDLVRFLRARCPWDAEQTPTTLVPHLLEEAHEVADAVRDGDPGALAGELGDLLLNVAFQVVLGEETGDFDAGKVYAGLEDKMVRRHPQLFGGADENPGWERLKAREREGNGGVLSGLARGLDPLTGAHRIQERVAGVGFDWPDHRGALDKVREELEEVVEALPREGPEEPVVAAGGSGSTPDPTVTAGAAGATAPGALDEELGDLLFAVVNLVRLTGRHPATVLDAANRKFRRRFEAVEALAADRGIALEAAGLEALDTLWDEVKAGAAPPKPTSDQA